MDNPWIVVYPSPKPSRLRLLCFPYAGAGASIFRSWTSHLPPDVEVWAIQLPGREFRWREPLFTHIQPLIAALTSHLVPHLESPFAFFGHSVGALIAFELTRSLQQAQGPMPLQLIVSGRQSPQSPLVKTPVMQLSDAELMQEVRQYGGTPEAVLEDKTMRQFILSILRADLTVNDTYSYTPSPPLSCPMAIFGSKNDELTSPEGIMNWQQHSAAEAPLYWFTGGHFFLKTEQVTLLETISDLLKVA